ncbi:MAG: ribonuclease E, partial [Pseudoalteromonas tunicata]|nr:ribonuclease E [Pseudoalteromonas tunicata]
VEVSPAVEQSVLVSEDVTQTAIEAETTPVNDVEISTDTALQSTDTPLVIETEASEAETVIETETSETEVNQESKEAEATDVTNAAVEQVVETVMAVEVESTPNVEVVSTPAIGAEQNPVTVVEARVSAIASAPMTKPTAIALTENVTLPSAMPAEQRVQVQYSEQQSGSIAPTSRASAPMTKAQAV